MVPTDQQQVHTRRWRRFNIMCGAFCAVAALAMPTLNLAVDPYGLLGTSALRPGPTTAQRAAQLEHLLANPGRYNTLMLGTSVMGINNPAVVERALPGARAYNLSFFLASARDLLLAVQALDRASALPPNVIIGVDPFLVAPRDQDLRQEFRFPPVVTGESQAKWWLDALFAPSVPHATLKILDQFKPLPSVRFDPRRGHYELPTANALLLSDPAAHAKKAFTPTKASFSSDDAVEAELAAIKDLAVFLASRATTVVWFLQPTSAILRQAFRSPSEYEGLMRRIRAAVPAHALDLSTPPGVYDDPMAWYDMKHMTASTSAAILQRAIKEASASGVQFDLEQPLMPDRLAQVAR